MMKKTSLFYCLFIFTPVLFAQEIKISVAPTINNAFYFKAVDGGPGRNFKPGFSALLEYSFPDDKIIKLGVGICYQFAMVEYTPNMNTGNFTGQTDKLSLASVNFAAIFNLGKDFYLSLTPLISLQLNYDSNYITDRQSGPGISFSFGKHLKLNDKIKLNIEPEIRINNIIPFRSENLPLRLTSAGINFGLVFCKN